MIIFSSVGTLALCSSSFSAFPHGPHLGNRALPAARLAIASPAAAESASFLSLPHPSGCGWAGGCGPAAPQSPKLLERGPEKKMSYGEQNHLPICVPGPLSCPLHLSFSSGLQRVRWYNPLCSLAWLSLQEGLSFSPISGAGPSVQFEGHSADRLAGRVHQGRP